MPLSLVLLGVKSRLIWKCIEHLSSALSVSHGGGEGGGGEGGGGGGGGPDGSRGASQELT